MSTATLSASAANADRPAPQYVPTFLLDSIRGVLALEVLVYHARLFFFGDAPLAQLLAGSHALFLLKFLGITLTKFGGESVIAFFLISGYAIHYRQAAGLARDKNYRMDWRIYAWRRVRRIYPPLIVALLVTLVCGAIGNLVNRAFYSGTHNVPQLGYLYQMSIRDFVGALLFVQGFATKMFGNDGPLWSLAFEGFFYLAYPVVLFLNRKSGAGICLAIFIALGGLAVVAMHVAPQLTALSLIRDWPIWVAGAFVADLRAGRVHPPHRVPALAGALGVVTMVVMYAVSTLVFKGQESYELWLTAWSLAFFLLLIWFIGSKHQPRVAGLLGSLLSPLEGLGAMSYSLYLVHVPVLALICAAWLAHHRALPGNPTLYVAAVAIAFAVAYGAYLIGERPVTGGPHRTQARAPSVVPALGYTQAGD